MSNGSGVLFVVATPIGNLGDISSRAIDVLRSVDLIAAEDTRHTGVLLRHLGITTRMLALHDHNERQQLSRLIAHLQSGASLAMVADAGTPLISDPGYSLVRECHLQGIRVSPVPGASALTAALSVAGLATDRALYVGFIARTGAARRAELTELRNELATLVFYESSHRIVELLADLVSIFGRDRPAVLARELTKLHETIIYSVLGDLQAQVSSDSNQRKGEFVLLVAGAPRLRTEISADATRILSILCDEFPIKQAVRLAAQITGEKKNRLYPLALERKGLGSSCDRGS